MTAGRKLSQRLKWVAWGLVVYSLLVPGSSAFSVTWNEAMLTADFNWQSVAMSSDGSKMLAAVDGGRLYRYSAGIWAETQPAGNVDNQWQSVAMSSDGSKMLAAVDGGRLYRYGAGIWAETQPAGNMDKAWYSVAVSSDGSKMLAAVNGGRLYLYSNGVWAEIQPAGNVDKNWYSVALSSDGSAMLAGVSSGRLYVCRDGVWAEPQPAGNVDKQWQSVAVSSDGSAMLAGANAGIGGRLYVCRDGVWAETQPAGNVDKQWRVALSSDGSAMLAGVYVGRLYLYSNGAWAETQPAGNVDTYWLSLAMSSDGSKMLAAGNGRVYLYSNGTWTETQPAGNVTKGWRVALSSDGSAMLAAVDGGRVYLYSNGAGAETQPAGNVDKGWYPVALSSDGSAMLAGVYGGRLYESSALKVTGTVKDFITKETLANAVVTIKDEHGNNIGVPTTNASGMFSQTVPMPGYYTVSATLADYSMTSPPQYVYVSSDSATSVTVYMRQMGAVYLFPGWNFVSTPKQPSDAAVATVLSDISPNLTIVWAWDAATQTWLKYRPSGSGNTLTTFDSGKGYWLYMSTSAKLPITGSNGSNSVTLADDWNLIGYNGTDGTTLTTGLQAIAGKWVTLWGWEDGTWFLHDLIIPDSHLPEGLSPLTLFNQGKAYWIKVKQGQAGNWPQ